MNRNHSILLSLVLSLTLALCACTTPKEHTPVQFTSQGVTLTVPHIFADLLTVDTTPSPGQRSTFFSVHETASLEAAKAINPNDIGGGFLFGIGTVDHTTFMDMMCTDMTGAQVFARDEVGNYYMYYHPTDVQLVRTGEYTNADWDQWLSLSDWGATITDTLLADNPHLIPYARTHTDLDLVLSRIAHQQLEITLSPYEGEYMYASSAEQSAPFLALLPDGLQFTSPWQDISPGGEFIKLSIPNFVWTFDFFTEEDSSCYIRQTFGDGGHIYHMATLNGESFPIGDVIAQWADSIQSVSPPLIKIPPTVSILVPTYEQPF